MTGGRPADRLPAPAARIQARARDRPGFMSSGHRVVHRLALTAATLAVAVWLPVVAARAAATSSNGGTTVSAPARAGGGAGNGGAGSGGAGAAAILGGAPAPESAPP